MRGTPLLVQILFVYFVLPSVGVNLPAFTSGILALTLNAAAYISEVIRAGILSIDAGQMEAARALGMSYWQAMRRIILPQTFRRVVPPLTNEGIALLKDSSLVSVIGLTELARTGQELASRYAAPLTIWPLVALLYLALTFPLTQGSGVPRAPMAAGDARVTREHFPHSEHGRYDPLRGQSLLHRVTFRLTASRSLLSSRCCSHRRRDSAPRRGSAPLR